MDKNKLKEILNNVVLLKFIKVNSADNLLEDNKLAKEKFGIETSEDSISVMDTTATKMIVTSANFDEKNALVKFNLKQLQSLIDCVGSSGELIIPKSKSGMNEMIAKVGSTLTIVCPLPKADKSQKE